MTQPLARSQTTGHIIPQGSNDFPGNLAESQLAAMDDVTMICVTGLNSTYLRVRGFLDQPGRTPEHQQWLTERAGRIFGNFEVAVDVVHRRTIQDILDNRPRAVEQAPQIIEVPQRGIIPRLFGR
jgi:hypothetical protein